MHRSSPSTKIDFVRLSLGVRWDAVLFPFEQWKFLDILPEHGYSLDDPESNLRSPFGMQASISGQVAKKGGDIKLSLNSQKPQLVIEGPNPAVLAEEFQQIESVLSAELKFDSESQSSEHECDASLLVSTDQSPLKSLSEFWSGYPRLESIGSLIGLEDACTNSSLRLVSLGRSPLDRDWFELRVDPSVQSPDRNYFCVAVYRNPDREKVFHFLDRLQATITNLISRIEAAE